MTALSREERIEYYENVRKRAEEKCRLIKELHHRLKYLIPAQEDRLTVLLQEKEATLLTIEPQLELLYLWTQQTHSTLRGRRRFNLAQLITAITWIDVDKARKYVSTLKALPFKAVKAFKLGYKFKEILQYYGTGHVLTRVSSMMRTLSEAVSLDMNLAVDIIDHETASIFSPLARIIFRNTLFNYTRGTREGARIGVTADLGGGKTTFAYLSIYAVLRTFGIPRDDAVRYAHAMLTNDPIEWVVIMRYLTREDVFAPAIIADDIASMISKHWIFESQHVRNAVLRILKAIKISREGFGAVIFPTDTKEALTKSIRESLDIEYNGEPERLHDRIGTIWIDTDLQTTLQRRTYRASTIRSTKIMKTICATVHPPLLIPPTIYASLEKQKKKARAQWLLEAEEELTKAFLGEEKRKKKETTITEEWGI